MRKEVLLAVIFGIILGGVVLFGINLANKSVLSDPSENQTISEQTPAPATTIKTLSIITPQNHSVSSEKTITLAGRAVPGSSVAIVSESDDIILDASPEGTFSAEINLISGENIITVTQLQTNNSTESEAISVIQSSNLPE